MSSWCWTEIKERDPGTQGQSQFCLTALRGAGGSLQCLPLGTVAVSGQIPSGPSVQHLCILPDDYTGSLDFLAFVLLKVFICQPTGFMMSPDHEVVPVNRSEDKGAKLDFLGA